MTFDFDRFVKENEALCEAATSGPWNHEHERYSAKNVIGIKPRDDRWLASCQPEFNGHDNADFIAQSRTSLPQALKLLKKYRAALKFYSEDELCSFAKEALAYDPTKEVK